MVRLPILVAAGVLVAACSSDVSPTAPISVPVFSDSSTASHQGGGGNYGTPLSGAEEVPARNTRARGNAIFQLNAAGDEMSFKLIVANISNVTQAHIHRGPFGANGPIIVWLYPNTQPPAGPPGGGRLNGVIAEDTIAAADFVGTLAGEPMSTLVDLLKTGQAYVNVHTSDGVNPPNSGPGNFPGGEVRGQIEHRGH